MERPPERRPGGAREVFLKPGDWCFAEEPVRMRTVLGSCVSLAVWHPLRHFGGMCHFMLPARSGPAGGAPLDGRYADEAMALLLSAIRQAGTEPGDYQLKIFGGGRMFPSAPAALRHHSVPQRNIAAAETLARRHGMVVCATDVGEQGHRQVVFDSWSGDAWVRHFRGAEVHCDGCGWRESCVLA
jgi:chemotaxis protein CheD